MENPISIDYSNQLSELSNKLGNIESLIMVIIYLVLIFIAYKISKYIINNIIMRAFNKFF